MVYLKLSDLDSWCCDIRLILKDIHICFHNFKRVRIPKNKSESNLFKGSFFEYYKDQMYFILIIQLAKILVKSDQQRRSFHKLFSKIRVDKFDYELNKYLKSQRSGSHNFNKKRDLLEWISSVEIRINEKSLLIDNLESLRNKVYAHKDPQKPAVYITESNFEELIDLCTEIYIDFESRFFGNTVSFENNGGEIDAIISKLGKSRN